MPASYQSSAGFPASGSDVYQACLTAVPQCGFSILSSNQATGQIAARAGIGLRSWGENITIAVSPDGRVNIKSSCRGFQMVDYGKNKANVEKIFSALAALLQPRPQVP
jgi:hypothetical protein